MINYSIIDQSVRFYESKGFQRVESPWTVTKAISDITKPEGSGEWTIKEKNKVLVASGEQSFLYLYNKGFLPKGKFQTVTPCFREEPFDDIHTKYFIKNELIITDEVSHDRLMDVINDADKFFAKYLDNYVQFNMNSDGTSGDLSYKGIELGSYGIRECGFLKWIYGTGVAEPRLTRVMKKYDK